MPLATFESPRRKRDIDKGNHFRKVHTYTIEVVVAFDSTIESFHNGENLEEYILSLMFGASNIYADPSIGHRINLSVKKIISVKDVNVDTIKADENG